MDYKQNAAINICLEVFIGLMWVEGGNWSKVDQWSGAHSYAWVKEWIWDLCQGVLDGGFNLCRADFIIWGSEIQRDGWKGESIDVR